MVICFMITHALFLTLIFWHDTKRWDKPFISSSVWWVLFWAWPAWAVWLWKFRLKSRWSIVLPVIVSLVALSPVLFMLVISGLMAGFKHI